MKLKLEKLVELVKIELEDQIADQIENEGFIQKIMSENATLRELLQISKFNEEDYEKFKKEIDSVAIKLESEYFDEQSTKNHLQRQQDKFNLERYVL